MVRKLMSLVLMLVLIVGLTVVSADKAFAFTGFGNGDFELGNFNDWVYFGNIFLDTTSNVPNAVINGTYSAALINNEWSFILGGLACTSLESAPASPVYVPKAVRVSFKVSYKTEWLPGDWITDPAHAVVWTDEGGITVFSINPSGVTAGLGFSVTRLDTMAQVPNGMPPFHPGVLPPFVYETPTLLVSGTLPVSGCSDSTVIEFDICNMLQIGPYSGLWVDDVTITYINAASTTTSTWWKTPTGPSLCP